MKFHCFATHFTSISCSSETTKGREGKSIHFLKALFKTNSEINLSMQRKEHILKMNVFLYLKAEKVENFSTSFSNL